MTETSPPYEFRDATGVAVPAPGHHDALARGCTCPQIDNHFGEGRPSGQGFRHFIVYTSCPLHRRNQQHAPAVGGLGARTVAGE